MIPKEKIDELREKLDIVDVISSYVPSLRKRGKNHMGLCPFHSEKTPSFTVSQEKGLYHCFGCGKGGNVFSFLMEMENISFGEALKIAADKAGIPIEAGQFAKAQNSASQATNKLFTIMELACKFYEGSLDKIKEYLDERKISDPKSFRLGFARDGWDNLLNFLLEKGAKIEDIEAAGLILKKQSGSGYYDRFRNRLMFPIMDQQNRVIGFGGRAVNNEEPKYLNSPESAIFNKGANLYNLGKAKDFIKRQKFALLVEGYMDTIACCEIGLDNSIAPLGTAVTSTQAKLLSRFTKVVVLAFDSDAAGLSASERAQEILEEAGISVRIASCQGGKDPDEIIKKLGKEAFIKSVQTSIPATEFKIKRVLGRFNIKEIEDKVKAAYEIAQFLSKEKDNLLQSEYAKFAAKLLNLPVEEITAAINSRNNYQKGGSNLKRAIPKAPSKVKEAEKKILKLILEWDEALSKIKEELTLNDFNQYKGIFEQIWTIKNNDILSSINNESDAKVLREIALSEEPLSNKDQMLKDCISSIKAFTIQNEMGFIRESLLMAEKNGEEETVNELKKRQLYLNEILRMLIR